jgi:hypothetical protein
MPASAAATFLGPRLRRAVESDAWAVPCDSASPTFDNQLRVATTRSSLWAQTLVTLRDTLLPRLISGQLRLPHAEALTA